MVKDALVLNTLDIYLNIQLGCLLNARFKRFGRSEDNDEAISVLRRVLDIAPDDDSAKSPFLNKLGIYLQSRFERVGELEDLEAAISVQRRAVELTPDGHPAKPARMNNLGNALQSRFERVGELEDLEAAISMQRRAVELTPDGHPAKPARMNNLGNALQSRFERVGELEDIEATILLQRRAVDLTPDGHPGKPSRMNSLSIALQRRFERVGELEDLEAAISVQRSAVDHTPDGHPDRPGRINNLGISLQSRFERVGELADLEAAISVQRRAVNLTPDGHPDKSGYMNNLGNALRIRFEHVGELEDLEAAISVQHRAVELTPEGHPNKPMYMSNLGISLQSLFERVGKLADLEAAILVQRRAVDLTPDGHSSKPMYMNNLGNALRMRFKRAGELGDLEASISTNCRAVDLTPDGHPGKCLFLHNLGLSFHRLHKHSSTPSHLEAAYRFFMDAAIYSSGSPFVRFMSARDCVDMFAEKRGFVVKEMLLQAHSHVLRLLPELVWLGHSVSRRYEESSKLADCVNDAVSSAIEHEALSQAVAWLEEGRSLVWSQVLALRSPLDDLETQHPELSQRLRLIQEQLQQSGHVRSLESVDESETTNFVPNEALDKHRGFSIQYGRILSDIRSCAGFENFLHPKPLSAMLPSPYIGDGYVVFVFVNAYHTCCDALVLTMPIGEIKWINLPDLTDDRSLTLHSLWTKGLRDSNVRVRAPVPWSESQDDLTSPARLLELMWKWIVHPILQSMNIVSQTADTNSLPHITWCPTGPLTQLPLHAAGVYSDPNGPRVFDRVVSSYTSSLSALLRSSEGIVKQQSSPSMLIVTQPTTPGQSRLPGTVAEGGQLQKMLSDSQIPCAMLDDTEATVDAVRSVIDQHSWVHLACHGLQHTGDATQSAFYLYDGPLSLSDLMQTAADGAELAFLSACQTATGDEKNPEESVHLAAGMLAVGFKGVVATMWSIGDKDAPIVVEAYYKKLLGLRRTGAVGKGQTGAAYALHEAVKVLRDHVGEKNFLSWAPFVHFGA
ncbi:TPR-like protein [Peniophora sp. CONT]|nr:TPR-like protein [Peniophora sp. CONT]